MNEASEYVCDICGETFESEQELKCHVRDTGLVD
jgi:DNA-directed RNA polymerase subunit RPC12/RpoP